MASNVIVIAEYAQPRPKLPAFESFNGGLTGARYLYVNTPPDGRVSMAVANLDTKLPWDELRPAAEELARISNADVSIATVENSYTPPEKDLEDYPPAAASLERLGRVLPKKDRTRLEVHYIMYRDTGQRAFAVESAKRVPAGRLDQIRKIAREMFDGDRVEQQLSSSFRSIDGDDTADSIPVLTVLTSPDGEPFFGRPAGLMDSAADVPFGTALDRVGEVTAPGTDVIVRGSATQFDELELSYVDAEDVPRRALQNTTSHLLGALDTEEVLFRIDGEEQIGVASFSNGSFVGFRPDNLFEFVYSP